ncbi:MAG: NERD domain-containing protein [Ruminococcaceae bacterium]|nr:NERD domain-containing protein [Oscillospiraceae bacterium]
MELEQILPILLICGGIAAAIALAIVLVVLIRHTSLKKAGKLASQKAGGALKNYAATHFCKTVNDVTLPHKGVPMQIDHLLVGYFGVLLVSSIEPDGDIYGALRDDTWLISNEKNGRRSRIKNLYVRTENSVLALRDAFKEAKVYNVPVESLIVVTRKKSSCCVPELKNVMSLPELKKYLRKSKFETDNNVDVDAVLAAIEKAKLN